MTLTADSTDGKATDFKIGGAFTMMIMIILFQKVLADAKINMEYVPSLSASGYGRTPERTNNFRNRR
ncbi:MAG: hypothetical protein ACLR13_10000 [Acutalibacteraceae bacterium]